MTSSHNQYDNLSRRDYRLVEKNDASKFRMPLGMRPENGGIPTACRKWENGIFLPSEPFLTECYFCHLRTIFPSLAGNQLKITLQYLL